RSHARESLDDDLFAGLKSVFDDDQLIADLLAGVHRAKIDLAIRRDDPDLIRALELADRALWHDQRSLPGFDRGAHLAVLAGPEDVAGIRESALQGDRAGPWIDLAIGHDHRAARRIHAAVLEDELEDRVVAPRGLRPVVAPRGAEIF